MSFQAKEQRKARCQHLCECCFRIVNPGEQYVKVAGQSEGDFYSAKTCMACDSLIELVWSKVDRHEYPDGIAFHELFEVAADLELACWIPQNRTRTAA
ncbi:hypothetical protein QO209_31000 [Pseudomonas citronellolis]|uniref:hypothetical protein n=1 Tax=Pseudomonas citronellolis TaxID=53408 RepID=UPI002648F37F|nr:hypothetical protein [Pseudomonas citronellolis]MDN6876894.1 hypothetical protein [Pseudomonas citronellolis]